MVLKRPNLITSRTDVDAVRTWLENYKGRPRTLPNYRKEADRFLLWTNSIGKTFAELTHEDCLNYRDFLYGPPEDWISKKKFKRSDKRWRPFAGSLSIPSAKLALTTCNMLLNWLVVARYLEANPMSLLRTRGKGTKKRLARFISPGQFGLILETVQKIENVKHRHRARWIFCLLYLSMTRINEVATARMNSIFIGPSEGKSRWWFYVLGKGDKERDVPVNSALLNEFSLYREAEGLPPLPSSDDNLPLVLRLEGDRKLPMTSAAIHGIIKAIIKETTEQLKTAGNAADADAIKNASAHWFRHSGASDLAGEIDLPSLRDILGHENISTTNIYVHTEEDKLHDLVEAKHQLPTKGKKD